MSNIRIYSEEERKKLKKEGFTDFDISMDLVGMIKTPGRLVEVTREQWENAHSTCMKQD